jgi:hypothetical protein
MCMYIIHYHSHYCIHVSHDDRMFAHVLIVGVKLPMLHIIDYMYMYLEFHWPKSTGLLRLFQAVAKVYFP